MRPCKRAALLGKRARVEGRMGGVGVDVHDLGGSVVPVCFGSGCWAACVILGKVWSRSLLAICGPLARQQVVHA